MHFRTSRPKLSSLDFNAEIITNLVLGTQEIDCPMMELERALDEEPRTFKGPGYLKRDANGKISFKLYPIDPPPGPYIDDELYGDTKAGQYVNKKYLYRINLTDYSGQSWKSDFFTYSTF